MSAEVIPGDSSTATLTASTAASLGNVARPSVINPAPLVANQSITRYATLPTSSSICTGANGYAYTMLTGRRLAASCLTLALAPQLVAASIATATPLPARASHCQRQIPNGPNIAFGATYIVEYRGMSCQAARRVVLTADKRRSYSRPIDGLRCQHLNVATGGGEEVCKAPHRFLKLAFE